jgi:hypothetical protein
VRVGTSSLIGPQDRPPRRGRIWVDFTEHFELVRSMFEALIARRELLLDHLTSDQQELVLT